MTEAIDYRNAIESLFQVVRDNDGTVTDYGLIGKYTYNDGWEDTAFSVGIVPTDIVKVEGIELVLRFPDTAIIPISNMVLSENNWSMSIIIRDGVSLLDAANVAYLLMRSNYFDGFRIGFQDANPKVGNFPQYYCQWKNWAFRNIII